MDLAAFTDPALDAFLDETRALNKQLVPQMAKMTFDLRTVEGAVKARSEAGGGV